MNTVTLPKKGLKKYDYNIDMDMKDHIATLPKKGLKKYDYNIDMDMKDHITTLPKKGLKTRPYNIGMEKRDLRNMTILCIWIWRRNISRNSLRDS